MSKLNLVLIIFLWIIITSSTMLINKCLVVTMVLANVMLLAVACYLIYKLSITK